MTFVTRFAASTSIIRRASRITASQPSGDLLLKAAAHRLHRGGAIEYGDVHKYLTTAEEDLKNGGDSRQKNHHLLMARRGRLKP
jgi:hypothetical protein